LATNIAANVDEAIACLYAADLLHRALLEAGEPQKASEAAKLAGHPGVDLRLARVVFVLNNNRFTSSDRKWTLWSRFSDPTRPVERNLQELLNGYGQPASLAALSRELSAIYHRSEEYYASLLTRLLTQDTYFTTGNGYYGLRKWLLDVSDSEEEGVLFDNYLKKADVDFFIASAEGLDGSNLETIYAFLDNAGVPVPNRLLQFLVWSAKKDTFDAQAVFSALWNDGRAALLSNGAWAGPKLLLKFGESFEGLAVREVDEHGDNTIAESIEPLAVTHVELDQLVEAIQANELASHAGDLLESIFEVPPADSTYSGDLDTVLNALKEDDRVVWVGSDRFLPQGAIPEYVFTVPEILSYPENHYTDLEGNEVDLLLEDDGFDGGLQRDVLSMISQDVLDEEPAYTPESDPPATARCVLKFHHKEIGTFPLCQLPPGFFPVDAPILQVALQLPTGHKIELWVNNEIRLVYGLLDWYQTLPVDSGAVFYLERQSADRYVLTYGEETEPSMFISRNRVNELLDLGNRAENEELPTFEIVREIMEHYRKGIEFITLLTEVNISRRTTRRMVASLLSGNHCFFQRVGSWVFDAKKLSQGFDKSKRKYLLR